MLSIREWLLLNRFSIEETGQNYRIVETEVSGSMVVLTEAEILAWCQDYEVKERTRHNPKVNWIKEGF